MAKIKDWTISNAEEFAEEIADVLSDPQNGTVCKVFSKELYQCDCCPLNGLCSDKQKLIKFLKQRKLR